MEIKPFKKIPIVQYFQHDLEKIKMAYRLSGSIQLDLSNLRAAGDEVEFAIKDFFVRKLSPRYHICDGHIIDSNLKASPQFDLIICENSKNPVLFDLSDKSQMVYYESVFCFGEVKKSFYDRKIIKDFSTNIKRLKSELNREAIPPNFIECANSGFQVEEPLTSLPLRNPVFSFLFFVNTSANNFSDFGKAIAECENRFLPNFIVLLDAGIILNVNKQLFESGKIKVNLYPEFETEESLWVLMDLGGEHNVLTYQYMLLLEHLNATVVSSPNIKSYVKGLFDFSFSNFHKL